MGKRWRSSIPGETGAEGRNADTDRDEADLGRSPLLVGGPEGPDIEDADEDGKVEIRDGGA